MMDDKNQELNQAAKAGDLDNLPEAERKETMEILDGIDKDNKREGSEVEPDDKGKKPEGDEKPEDGKEKKEPEKKPAEKKPEEDGKKPEEKVEKRREAKLIPAWQYEIAKKKMADENSSLKAEIERLSGKAQGDLSQKGKDDLKKEIEKLAEDEGVSSSLVERMLDIMKKNADPAIPQEFLTKLEEVDRLRAEREVEVEEAKFSRDFDATIVPLVRAEYGDNVPQHVIDEVKNDLKELAYSEEYGKIPYSTIYKGEDKFRSRVAPAKKGAEGSSAGTFHKEGIQGSGGKDLSKPLSDQDIRTLSDKDFETYMNNMEAYEKNLSPR